MNLNKLRGLGNRDFNHLSSMVKPKPTKKNDDPYVMRIARNQTLAEKLVPQGKLEELKRMRKLNAAASQTSMTDWYDSQYMGFVIVGTPGVVSLRG